MMSVMSRSPPSTEPTITSVSFQAVNKHNNKDINNCHGNYEQEPIVSDCRVMQMFTGVIKKGVAPKSVSLTRKTKKKKKSSLGCIVGNVGTR